MLPRPPESVLSRRTDLSREETDCPLCGSPECSPLLAAPDFLSNDNRPCWTVVRCRACGLCFTNPRPAPADIGRFYADDYGPHRPVQHAANSKRRERRWSSLVAHMQGRRPERWHIRPQGQCRLLDFGCGNGAFLQQMHRRGWNVLGLDASVGVVERILCELQLPALTGTLPHTQLVPESFDLITMWQSLEHVHRPLDVLHHAHELLSPGGRLIVSVPNIDSDAFRWFGASWFGLDVPRHLTHFAPATLQEMVRRAGFRVGSVRMVRHKSWLQASARRAAASDLPARRTAWLRRRALCRPASWYSLLRRRSDCIVLDAEKPE